MNTLRESQELVDAFLKGLQQELTGQMNNLSRDISQAVPEAYGVVSGDVSPTPYATIPLGSAQNEQVMRLFATYNYLNSARFFMTVAMSHMDEAVREYDKIQGLTDHCQKCTIKE